MDHTENVSFIIAVLIAMETSVFAKLLLSGGCCIVACFVVVA
jgi:hypothetical protein